MNQTPTINQAPAEEKSTHSMNRLNHKSAGLINQAPTVGVKEDFAFFRLHILLEYFPNFKP